MECISMLSSSSWYLDVKDMKGSDSSMRFRSSTVIRDVSEQTRISNWSFLKPAGVSKLKLQKKFGYQIGGNEAQGDKYIPCCCVSVQ